KGSILKVAMHHSDIAFGGQGRIWGRVNRFYVRRFHRYIATSRQIFDEFVEEGMARERVVRLPNGVDMERFRPAESEAEKDQLKERLGLPRVPVALFTGIVLARKNVDYVLRVFLKIREKGLEGHLVIAGPSEGGGGKPGGPYFDRLQEMIRTAGMEKDVTFTCRIGNVEEYIRASDMFLFAPHKEGMPNVLLEAMSGGLPCVVSRISGIEDVIESGVNGFIFDLANESGYEDAVTSLFRNPELRAEISDKARKRIQARFSLERVADEYCRIYRELRHNARSV
ncbi:MAG: glycosyltransferase family 4 protein, partial [Acidobacteria bacterium]|nr:glycosyltransferase family 4 protein [Candidatus Polarisedimenticola svalbardensis]